MAATGCWLLFKNSSLGLLLGMDAAFTVSLGLDVLCFVLLQEMSKRELHCPNLQVQRVAALVAPPRPVKPTHSPIADIIRVSNTLDKTGNAINHLYRKHKTT